MHARERAKLYLKPWSHISVIRVSPGKTVARNLPDMVLTALGSPLHIHLMIAFIANPSVHSPCSIGRGNLHSAQVLKKQVSVAAVLIDLSFTLIRSSSYRSGLLTRQVLQRLDLNAKDYSHQRAYRAKPADKYKMYRSEQSKPQRTKLIQTRFLHRSTCL